MIHKIESLVSIGKFGNYQASGDVVFKKLTLFYADNGSGKTTISSVFRSLTENDPRRIEKRKTLSSTLPQGVRIIQRPHGTTNNIPHVFSANTWGSQYDNIEIFDIHFVDENIYSGCSFSDDHKKQLHQFVIGAQGVAIQQQLDQNKTDKTNSRNTQTNLENQLILGVANGLTQSMTAQFLAISPSKATNINAKVAAATASLAHANSNAVIQTLQLLSSQTAINVGIDFQVLQTDIQTTIQNLQDASLQQLFDQHCENLEEHGITEPKGWLNTGFRYHISQTESGEPSDCPFCKQSLDTPTDIINAYNGVFNTVFNEYLARLQGHLQALGEINLDVEIQRIESLKNNNSNRVTSWAAHLDVGTLQPLAVIINDAQALRDGLANVVSLVQQKIANPSINVNVISIGNFEIQITAISDAVIIHNQQVSVANASINSFRSGIKTVVQAQAELNELTRIKKRFEPEIDMLCTQLQAERATLKGLESAYTSLSQQQLQTAQTFFTTYKDRVNYYLQNVFKTLFRIDNIAHVAPQGRGTQNKVNYRLTLNGHEISFDHNQQNNVKDCLSEGDKSTIALAFFLSKLDIDPAKTNKILIFDDPLSSLDSNRRMYTVQLIQNLLPQIKQIVVLSHNEYFLHEIYKRVSAAERKTLRIFQNYQTGHSGIEDFNLNKLVENDYFKHLKELEEFLQHPNISQKDTVLGWLRNVLEAHIRFKFHRQLSGIPQNDQTFGRIITHLSSAGVVFRDNNTQDVIDSLKLINNISCKPHHGEPTPDYASLGIDPVTMNETELCHFITDTINLIDNRL
jgi:wobble nucleotide-excising tRNase